MGGWEFHTDDFCPCLQELSQFTNIIKNSYQTCFLPYCSEFCLAWILPFHNVFVVSFCFHHCHISSIIIAFWYLHVVLDYGVTCNFLFRIFTAVTEHSWANLKKDSYIYFVTYDLNYMRQIRIIGQFRLGKTLGGLWSNVLLTAGSGLRADHGAQDIFPIRVWKLARMEIELTQNKASQKANQMCSPAHFFAGLLFYTGIFCFFWISQ